MSDRLVLMQFIALDKQKQLNGYRDGKN